MTYEKFTFSLFFITVISGIFWIKSKIEIFFEKKNKKNFFLNDFLISIFPTIFIVFLVRNFFFEPFQIPSGSMNPNLLSGDFILVKKFSYNIKNPINYKNITKISSPKRGDISVFRYPLNREIFYIKRIIGIPGDKIVYDYKNKKLLIYENFLKNQKLHRIPVIQKKIQELRIGDDFFLYNRDNSYKKQELSLYTESIGKLSYKILFKDNKFDKIDFYFQQEGIKLAEWIVPQGEYFVLGDNRDNSLDSRYWGFVKEEDFIGKAVFIWMSIDKNNKWHQFFRINRIGLIK
ncbi:signal peptidase I [bacterium endosymbiont of Pedicinus badii]|uniref:signal peptidase I n=1 Tax=bacterium endosymbiont of Pedicinus badii TaxID=1719126 RepID=UPI0009BB6AA4|nr:signal peptidase I [bacterium endosymbiont of Pedicinus badii]OQM34496.1 hypothetical protein AOQ89_01245 [bacterium endosymbiont of Pedicinus badii]